MLNWLSQNDEWIALLGVFSVLAFIGSLILIPLVIVSLPVDYFTRAPSLRSRTTLFSSFLHIGKNCLGVFFVLIGLIMLFLPGQGILALLLGLSLIDFPSKRRIQIKIIRMRRVRRSILWIRRKAKRAPLQIPEAD